MTIKNDAIEGTLVPDRSGETKKWIIPYCTALFAMTMLQISNMGFTPLMPGIQESWGLNLSQVGLFTGINGLSSLIMAIPTGLLIHRFGEKRVLSTGLLVVAIGLSIVAVSNNFTLGIVGRFVWQFGYKATFIACITAFALALPSRLKATGMGINGSFGALAVAIGAPLGGTLSLNFGWKMGMWGYTAITILGLIVFSIIYSPVKTPAKKESKTSLTQGTDKLQGAFRTPIVYVLSLLMCLGSMSGISLHFFLPTALQSMYDYSAMDTAALVSTGSILGIPLVLFLCIFADRIKNRKLALVIIVGLIMVLSLLLTSKNPLIFRYSAILIMATALSVPNLIYAVAGEVLAGRDVGNVMGLVGTGMGIAAYFGPQALGWLGDLTGSFAAGWYLMAAVSGAFCIILICLKIK
jgi:ACS family tartrate transporter-like MFS transporter